ncbi:MAG: hypothetical protein KIT72_06985 [Polyangiaceae bacterium]|nr:hypothetical protein [Polyangiaceae bacterium]MCW5790149.1 hypothetical protein [Polyangiaceae bacterium]
MERPCGYCHDGELCVVFYDHYPICVSEDLGRLFWERGGGDLVWYADGTPYTGEPIPQPPSCPEQVGELTLCGGGCGGCGPAKYCSGRSPTHPWGIWQDYSFGHCYLGQCGEGEACLILNANPINENWPHPYKCVDEADCAFYEANVPGGVSCE